MKRNYIQPQTTTLALCAEGALLTASLGAHDAMPQKDDANNLFSAPDSWSSEAWNENEE